MPAKREFVIKGKVRGQESEAPLGGLIVEALDKDFRVDDRLGTTVTNEEGMFVITYDEDDFQEIFFDRKPDIYIRVKNPRGETIYTTESKVRYEAGQVETFDILIAESLVERLKLEKVILSHLGEVIEDMRTVGDRIRYRIYYGGMNLRIGPEITIVDKVAKGLGNITVANGGRYDEFTRTIRWTVPSRSIIKKPYVEFECVVESAGVITNYATASGPGFLRARSNVVRTTVHRKPDLGWLPLAGEDMVGAPPQAYMKDETTMGTTVRFDIAGLFIYEEDVDGVAYHHVTIPGRAGLTEVGKPELPVVGEIIEVPFGVNFTPHLVKTDAAQVHGYNVYPAQEPRIDGATAPAAQIPAVETPLAERRDISESSFKLDQATYQADANYPDTPVTISSEDIGVIRGHRVLLLKVNPVQVNPAARTLTVHKTLEVRLEFDHPAQITGVEKRLQSPDFEQFLDATLLNYKRQGRFMTDVDDDQEKLGCDYLIIAHDNFYNESDPANPVLRLANWKRRKGYRTLVVTTNMIDEGDTAGGLETFLQDAYDTWYPPPSYVLLIGDSDMVVAAEGEQHPLEDDEDHPQPQILTDLEYVTVDGDDYFPDMFIGRISAETEQQVTDVVDKILTYEQTPPENEGFYANMSLVALFTETDERTATTPAIMNGREDRPWIANMEAIRGFLQGQGYTVERIYATDTGFPGDHHAQEPLEFNDGTDLPNDLLHPQYGWDGATNQITDAFNEGRFMLTYRAHGSWRGWGHPAFHDWNIPGLDQNDLTPLILSITCQTGWFDNETDDDAHGGNLFGNDCFAEMMLRRPHAGALGLLGMTRISWTGPNDFLIFGAIKAIWPAFNPDPHWANHRDIPGGEQVSLRKLGQIANFSKMYMARAYPASNQRQVEFEMHHLFGEPETTLWTSMPGQLVVDHPQGIGATGRQEFVVKVTDRSDDEPVVTATVVLTRGDEIVQMQQTGSDGLALFSLYNVGSGDLDLTVSARDFRPYLGTLEVTAAGAELNILDPDNGPENQVIHLGGRGFASAEEIEISFGQRAPVVATADGSGEFGQGALPFDLTVPAGHPHGLVNIAACGVNSKLKAVRIFQVRDMNPVDLWTYDQRNESTWSVHPGDNPTWNSPDIQLYDQHGHPVASTNLVLGETYTVRVKVRNKEAFAASNAAILFRWENYGAGGPWQDIEPIVREDIHAGPGGFTEVEQTFVPHETGHLCLQVTVEHVEDIDRTNSTGQENLHVELSHSPAKACFTVWNPTETAAPVHFEVRQLVDPLEPRKELWASWVEHPDPQFLRPGENAEACVIIDPDVVDAQAGETAEFAVTCFIGDEMIGGVNLIIRKE